eukprot:m.932499 g.932499  ORF g.932499 m.932499 type:complete len:150 (+) comp23790_c0_seq14:1378-1827(+)
MEQSLNETMLEDDMAPRAIATSETKFTTNGPTSTPTNSDFPFSTEKDSNIHTSPKAKGYVWRNEWPTYTIFGVAIYQSAIATKKSQNGAIARWTAVVCWLGLTCLKRSSSLRTFAGFPPTTAARGPYMWCTITMMIRTTLCAVPVSPTG